MRLHRAVAAVAAVLAATLSVPMAAVLAAGEEHPASLALVCDAVYQPARSSWVRTVVIAYDARQVREVRIDGLPVYSFSVRGTTILTALDNERIQIDTATRTWSSDFRGQASSQGRCERQD